MNIKRMVLWVPLCFILLSCATSPPSPQTPPEKPCIVEAHSAGVFEGTFTERAHQIATHINILYKGKFAVSYVELPKHGSGKNIFYGVHYGMFVVKFADLLTSRDEYCARKAIGTIFRLTTKHILIPSNASDTVLISHMGVQLVDADIWFEGGHPRGKARIFIARKEELIGILGASIPDHQWPGLIDEHPEKLIRIP